MSWLLLPVDRFLLGKIDAWDLQRWIRAAPPAARDALGRHNVDLIESFWGDSPEELDRQLRALYRVAFLGRDLRLRAAAIAHEAASNTLDLGVACSRLDELRSAGATFIPLIFHAYNGERDNVLNWEEVLGDAVSKLLDELATEPGVRLAIGAADAEPP